MHDIHLAIVWHQHQPYYPDDVSGENPMPWVRLHGTKDYWGMAKLLEEVPEFRATINLVPSLLVQLQKYEAGGEDDHLRVSRLPADGLSTDDMHYLLDNFFMVHPDHNIRPFARYNELYEKRGLGIDSAAAAARRFSKRDILDLQCWSNLVWIHPLAFEQDQELAAFRSKGHNWSEKEKLWFLAKQMELLGEVIPLHKKLADRGQVELSTTPFYHPILPLLWDKRLARQAMPEVGAAAAPRRLSRRCPGSDSPGRGIPRARVRHETARHVAVGRLGGPAGRRRDCRRRLGMDRHRRRNSFALDERLDFSRRPRFPAPSGDAVPALARRRQGPLDPNHLPRPCDERSDRVPLSGHFGRAGRQRLFRQVGSDRPRHDRQRRSAADVGEHHSRRRKLLGVLSHERRRFLAHALPPRDRASANHAHAGLRLSRSLSRNRQARPVVRRQLDPAQFWDLDWSSRVQSGLGSRLSNARVFAIGRVRRLEERRSTGPGPPRIGNRRGERLVLVVWRQPPSAPSKTCSTDCSASICKMSIPCSAIRRRRSCRSRSAWPRAAPGSIPTRPGCWM